MLTHAGALRPALLKPTGLRLSTVQGLGDRTSDAHDAEVTKSGVVLRSARRFLLTDNGPQAPYKTHWQETQCHSFLGITDRHIVAKVRHVCNRIVSVFMFNFEHW